MEPYAGVGPASTPWQGVIITTIRIGRKSKRLSVYSIILSSSKGLTAELTFMLMLSSRLLAKNTDIPS